MSQDTFPFGQDEQLPSYDGAEEPGGRRKLLIGGGVLAAVVVGAGAYLMIGGAGGPAVDTAFVPLHRTPTLSAGTNKELTKSGTPLPAPYKQQLGRDPFRALYVQPAAALVSPATGTMPITGNMPNTTTLGGQPTSTTIGTSTTGTGTTPVSAPTKEYKLVLTRVYGSGQDRTAVFSVDGKQQVAKIGTKFGSLSEIVLLSFQQGPKQGEWTTVLQVGDGDPFDVVTGVPAYVR